MSNVEIEEHSSRTCCIQVLTQSCDVVVCLTCLAVLAQPCRIVIKLSRCTTDYLLLTGKSNLIEQISGGTRVALSCLVIVKLIHWVWTTLNDSFALQSYVVVHVIRLTSVCATLSDHIVVIIARTSVHTLFGQFVISLVHFAHCLTCQNVAILV